MNSTTPVIAVILEVTRRTNRAKRAKLILDTLRYSLKKQVRMAIKFSEIKQLVCGEGSPISSRKFTQVYREMKRCHPDETARTRVNFSFRLGDKAHSRWTDAQERYILPILVANDLKPVASIVTLSPIELRQGNLKQLMYTNRWGVLVSLIHKAGVSPETLMKLADELLPYRDIGELYGYTDEFDISKALSRMFLEDDQED